MPHAHAAHTAIDLDDPQQALRQLGARAHQLRAATRAADHYIAQGTAEDRNTGSWLMSTALMLAAETAADVDSLARSTKERPSDAALRHTVSLLRIRAHQLHAAVRAADHYLDQDTHEDHDTGGWLIATALGLAQKLASELDDSTLPVRRGAMDAQTVEPHDAALARRVAAATAPLRGAA